MKKVSLIPVAAFLLIAVAVACNKTVPQPGNASSPAVTTGGTARAIPDVMVLNIGSRWDCNPGNGICNIKAYRILRGSNECGVTGDITPDGHLLLIADCSALNPVSWNQFISTGICQVGSGVVLPQDAVDAICDGQTPSIPHWGGPISIQDDDYPIAISNGAADKKLEIEGTYDPATESWSWAFRIH